jgi:tryptophanyl-tRNA synthetase
LYDWKFIMRILSGIQPSGTIHLGNYFGMIKPLLSFQDKGEVFAFLADYHSMTSLFDAKERMKYIMDTATTLLACGVDINKTTFFRQSSVPEVTELAWILSTVTPMGLLERCHSYKDKTAKGIATNHGLFAYPVLMAADILIYKSQLVPVGKDQQQHLEVARDIASHFNQKYGEIFPLPEAFIQPNVAVVPGTDGQKMSKSYGNTVDLFSDRNLVHKQIRSIVMDSRGMNEPKPDADKNNAIQLLKLISPEVGKDAEEKLRQGGMGYGVLKQLLIESYDEVFDAARTEYEYLSNHQDYVRKVLFQGGYVAANIAQKTLEEVKEAAGL